MVTAKMERLRVGETTEKLTINLGPVDLGQIDLLVQEGFYSNRTDLIRTAIRNQLSVHGAELKQSVSRRMLQVGLLDLSSADLEKVRAAGEMLEIQVVGLVRIGADVSAALARSTIRRVSVLGAWHASSEVRAALADRTA